MNLRTLPFFLLIALVSCTEQVEKKNQSEIKSDEISLEMEAEILSKIDCWLDNEDFYKFPKFPFANKKRELEIINVKLSPDSLKFHALVAITMYQKEDSIEIYSGETFIGYRENNKWKVYPFNRIVIGSHSSKEEVEDLLIEFSFSELKDIGVFVLKNQEYIAKDIGYNVDQVGYWNSVIWQKGNMIPGLYVFETIENGKFGFEKLHNPCE